MLWLAIYLPALPLEVFSLALAADGPVAVAAQETAPRILLCNRMARARGVCPGMGVGAAQALVTDLRVLMRDEAAEQAALRRLAAWAGQYSAQVSLEPPQALVLEVAGSVRLFGDLETLWQRVRQGLEGLGYAARLAVAPTPLGAHLLASADCQLLVTDRQALKARLAALPLSRLALERGILARLQDLGLQCCGDLLRLPRQGLRRRLGKSAMAYLDRLLGRMPDPRHFFQPPPGFTGRIALATEVVRTEALLFVCRRLILEMCGYLSAQACGVQRLEWRLVHEQVPDTCFLLGLLKPVREADYLQLLLRERLERVALAAPVLAIGLVAGAIQSLDQTPEDLFAHLTDGRKCDPNRLLERLRARLGEGAVHGLQLLPEYRPERAWRYCAPGESGSLTGNPSDEGAPSNPVAAMVRRFPGLGRRPLWLLPEPAPLEVRGGWPWWGGRLELEAERERIESGWWDGGDIGRDYFVARGPGTERLWIYRELRGKKLWFLHGFF